MPASVLRKQQTTGAGAAHSVFTRHSAGIHIWEKAAAGGGTLPQPQLF